MSFERYSLDKTTSDALDLLDAECESVYYLGCRDEVRLRLDRVVCRHCSGVCRHSCDVVLLQVLDARWPANLPVTDAACVYGNAQQWTMSAEHE